jgi:hypothetical protein
MLMDRAWGKAHQSTDTTITEQRAYVLCPPTMEDQEWKDYLEFKRPQLIEADRVAAEKLRQGLDKLDDRLPNPPQPNGKQLPKLN